MEAIKVILINLIVLAIGLGLYFKLRRDMRKRQVPNSPEIPILLLFIGYCGWIALLLTVSIWHMSAVASVEYLVLLVPMPVAILGCIGWLLPLRKISRYHRYALGASVGYLVVLACVWTFLLPAILRK